jgi:type 1 glutamine amidotransferase
MKIGLIFLLPLITFNSYSQSLPEFEITQSWLNKIESMVEGKKRLAPNKKINLLIFSLHTGYNHWTIPHTEEAIKIIALKTGDFNVEVSKDVSVFEKKNLSKYDVIVLNNNCSDRERRDMFWDVIKENKFLEEEQVFDKSKKLEKNLLKHIKRGNGLVVLHGGIVMQNNSLDFSEMLGGSFDFHPLQQDIEVKLFDPGHPLLKSFGGQGFTHYDEPYFFKNAYFDYNFRPLLYMNLDKIKMTRERPKDMIKYISWIKRYGRGRVFYSSPSHNAQSMDNPKLVNFFLNGLYYAAGELTCDDSPILVNELID